MAGVNVAVGTLAFYLGVYTGVGNMAFLAA
jgi:hypothetical protein